MKNITGDKLTLLDVDPPEWLNKITRKFSFKEEIEIYFENIFMSIRVFFRNIYFGVKNLFYYLPVVWTDRYWDFEYFFFQFLKYKLRNTREGIVRAKVIKEADTVGKEITTLLNYIDTYEDSLNIFEENNQDLLKKIKDEKDKEEKDKLVTEFVLKNRMFELDSYNRIFDYLKENCGKWWD
jgi:hypothetical protein